MAVPEEIRKVPRPTNTIVDDSGKDGVLRYAVRERSGTTYVPGCNPRPRNGRVVGHIIDGKYVPVQSPTYPAEPSALEYGPAALVRSVSDDIYTDLLNVYPANDAARIMVIAALRAVRPRLADRYLAAEYESSFLRKYYPGVALSKNTVMEFEKALGMNGEKREQFYQRRMDAVVKEHHIAIDGTLKQDSSRINDLSAFSYKARVKGRKEISVIYAYDLELMEPICAEVFPGNCIDASAYSSFIRDNNIQQGIIIADKGFPPSQIEEELKKRPNLHFITPIKRNDTRAINNNMYEYEGVLKGVGKEVYYKVCEIVKGKRYLYSYLDVAQEEAEKKSYAVRVENGKKKFDKVEFDRKKDTFGTIVLETDQYLDPKVVYQCYSDRWLLELVMKQYKSDEGLDESRVHGDYSIYGSEFINFIATLITCRVIRKAERSGLLDKMSYGYMMDQLFKVWRQADGPDPPKSDDGYWVHVMPQGFEKIEALGLSQPEAKEEPKKRGRPRKKSDETEEKTEPKKRGRPRKEPVEPEVKTEPKKRGRPRKEPVEPEVKTEPKKRGRPRKEPVEPEVKTEPKKRGRPRKEPTEPEAKTELKKRGRPRKDTSGNDT